MPIDDDTVESVRTVLRRRGVHLINEQAELLNGDAEAAELRAIASVIVVDASTTQEINPELLAHLRAATKAL
jgi:hypothetical protein|nr:hypothetical protein [Kofleriaceae bacterium]